jgi:hypothetical protein
MDQYLNVLFFILSTVLMNLWFSKAYNKIKSDPEIINIDIVDNRAHWVYDNVIYYADIVDNKIDKSTQRKIKI